jgi:hypothetical protein
MEEIEKAASADHTTGKAKEPRNVMRTVGIALVAALILVGVGFGIWGLVTHPEVTAVVRDLFIIVLALVTVIIGLFLIILIFQLQSLIALLRDEIKPILESANRTASTVRGTTSFVSDAVVSPVIRAASLAAGVGQTVRTLTRTGKGSQAKQTRTGSRQEP